VTTPTNAPPSREAEIAKRLEARQNEWRFYSEDMGEDCRYLLAQLQQARQELSSIDAILARRPALDQPTRWQNIEKAITVASRCDKAEAALQQARESLAKARHHLIQQGWPDVEAPEEIG
jgi:CHAD domain-containing protein